jgi:subtilisin-like proprotein convertase family protein
VRTRVVLVVLAALMALPLAPTVSPVGAKQRVRTVTRTFGNATAIALPIAPTPPVSAGLYPSTIQVSRLKGRIRDVNVRLNGLEHTYPEDIQVLLVGPDGQTAIVMADVGKEFDVSGLTLRLDDEAETSLPFNTQLRSGTFRPTNRLGNPIAFNAPAPATGANAALSAFDGGDPNGTWRLFVQDAAAAFDDGSFAGGWELELTVRGKVKKKKR